MNNLRLDKGLVLTEKKGEEERNQDTDKNEEEGIKREDPVDETASNYDTSRKLPK